MKNIGIICEYNPFHNGHARQLRFAKEQGNVICIMSGNYVQRGEPALLDKLCRAEAAVRSGADLVLELPVTYALRSAEGFADGGVEILSRLGCVTDLCFGSESGESESLMELAALLESPEFSVALKSMLDLGYSFPKARQMAVQALSGRGELLERPNDILGVEYCKSILRRNCGIRPMTLLREGSYHSSVLPEAPSATAIRSMDKWDGYMPAEAQRIQQKSGKHSLEAGERAVLARLRSMEEQDFSNVPFGSEGLWRKLMHASRSKNTVSDIIAASKSKRYTHSRLMRMIMCSFLGISEEMLMNTAPYVRILALNSKGGKLLRQIRSRSQIQLLPVGEQAERSIYRELERRSEALYGLFAEVAPEMPIHACHTIYCGDND